MNVSENNPPADRGHQMRHNTFNDAQRVPNLENRSELDQRINAKLEQLLLRARKFNEGNNGIIYQLPLADIDQELRELLARRGVNLSMDVAMKLLKIYSPGVGEREYWIQQEAHNLVSRAENPEKLAGIPTALFFGTISLGEDTKKKLSQDGALMGSTAEILLIDLLEGEDLATFLYRRALEEYNKAADEPVVIPTNFSQLARQVGVTFHFKEPGGKARGEGEREFERMHVLRDNATIFYGFLRKHRVRISEQVIRQFEQTFALLQQNGIRHQDAHERNLFVVGSPESDEVGTRGYLLDFGNAKHGGEDEERRDAGDDLMVMRRLRQLFIAPGDEFTEQRDRKLQEIYSLAKNIPHQARLLEHYQKLIERVKVNTDAIRSALESNLSEEAALKRCMAEFLKLAEDRILSKEDILALLNEKFVLLDARKKKPGAAPWVRNALEVYRELFA